jgi:hypothetical protein
MKVDKNQPLDARATNTRFDGDMSGEVIVVSGGSIPLRLEIAARLLAGAMADPNYEPDETNVRIATRRILRLADILIEAHNETCHEK